MPLSFCFGEDVQTARCFGEDVQTARPLFVRVKALGLRQFLMPSRPPAAHLGAFQPRNGAR